MRGDSNVYAAMPSCMYSSRCARTSLCTQSGGLVLHPPSQNDRSNQIPEHHRPASADWFVHYNSRSTGPYLNGHSSPASKKSNKRSTYKHVPHRDKPPHLVQRRNARERRRVQAVNNAFIRLRRHIPHESKNKRLSKVKTLRIAIDYINRLQDMIEDHDAGLINGYTSSVSSHRSGTRSGVTGRRCHVTRSQPGAEPKPYGARHGVDFSKENARFWVNMNVGSELPNIAGSHVLSE